MIRHHLLLFFICFLGAHAEAQKQFSVSQHDSLNLDFGLDLNQYVATLGRGSLDRNSNLDSFAHLRTSYFISVLRSSAQNMDLKELVGHIPSGQKAHRQFFSVPEIFSSPPDAKYPPSLPFLPQLKVQVQAEVMQESVYFLQTRRIYSDQDLLEKAIQDLAEHYTEDFILEGYKSSPSHHQAIKIYARKKFGSSTQYLISKEWKKSQKVWKYEVLVYSLAVFSD